MKLKSSPTVGKFIIIKSSLIESEWIQSKHQVILGGMIHLLYTTLHWTNVKKVIRQTGQTSILDTVFSFVFRVENHLLSHFTLSGWTKNIEFEIWDVGPVPFLKTLLRHFGTLRRATMTTETEHITGCYGGGVGCVGYLLSRSEHLKRS